ncbi:MAG: hypothetical protein HY699_01845 [Deltaproteobacteria bacterium]|nr:hypothetical protein [Deltaproteobacteria bacterium]
MNPIITAAGDPTISANRDGLFYMAAFGWELPQGQLVLLPRISHTVSTNPSGTAYEWLQRALSPSPAGSSILERPQIAVDRTTGNNSESKYLCTTYRNANLQTAIWVAQRPASSPDYTSSIQVSDVRTYPSRVDGCQVAVAPDGGVYVAWWEELDQGGGSKISVIKLRRSPGGLSFGPTVIASNWFVKPKDASATSDCSEGSGGLADSAPALKGHIRSYPFPSLAVSKATGTVYIAYNRLPLSGSGSQIAFVRSTNQGATWSNPLVVNDSAVGDKYMPAVAVSDYNNYVKVIWYDRRNDPNNLNIDVYSAVSSNSGSSFGQNVRLTNAPFGIPRLFPHYDCRTGDFWPQPASCDLGDHISTAGFATTSGFLQSC